MTMAPPIAPRRGFTLIELLVVVSIIAVLAGMLLPAVRMVMDAAKATACAGNLRQVAIAYQAYAGDNEGVLPNRATGMNNVQADPALLDDLLVSTDKAWLCSEPALVGSAKALGIPSVRFYQNWWITDTGAPSCVSQIYGASAHAVPLSAVQHPDSALLLADLDFASRGGYHRNKANVAFVDGHVLTRADASLTLASPPTVWMDPGPTVKTEYLKLGTGGAALNKLKGYTY